MSLVGLRSPEHMLRARSAVALLLLGALLTVLSFTLAADAKLNGLVLVAFTRLGEQTIVSIPVEEHLWRGTGRRLRWRFGTTRFDFDMRTGRFVISVHVPSLATR